MKKIDFIKDTVFLFEDIGGRNEIKYAVNNICSEFSDLFPRDKYARILIKPNCNNDMITFTGGTTDLRLIAAVVEFLQDNGFNNITIGDGPNSGAFHAGIDVLHRLRLKKLAHHYGIKILDFNTSVPSRIKIGRHKALVADACLHNDFMINLPKLKTHTEAFLSAACKNLVGCLKGRDKRQVHWNLTRNIVELNRIIKPNLHIVDGIIAMEGDGPSAGIPKKLGAIIAGTNPFLVDAVSAAAAGFAPTAVPYIQYALEKGIIILKDIQKTQKIHPVGNIKPANSNRLVNLLLSNYVILPRYKPPLNWIADSKTIQKFLTSSGIKQDVFIAETSTLRPTETVHDPQDIFLADACPIGLPLDLPDFKFKNSDCLKCLYCWFQAPKKIKVGGNAGHLRPQIKMINTQNYINKMNADAA